MQLAGVLPAKWIAEYLQRVDPLFLLVENGELYDPAPRGVQSILIANDRIEKIGAIDRRALDALGAEYDVIDATNCIVAPGLIDPHEHLLGGSGEGSLALQTPMLFIDEIVRAGVTTVVGTLGVDTTMKTIAGLLARVKALKEEGLSTRMCSGGDNVPPTTVLGSIREDMLFIEEVVGAGEIAISDERALAPEPRELASLVRDTHVGGLLSGKAGVSHFHVGEEPSRLAPLRELVDEFGVKPEWLYPTHVQRNEKLADEGIALAQQGAHVDFDVVEQDLAKWVSYYQNHGGPLDRLTVSSDSDSSTPDILYSQLCGLVVKHRVPLEQMLALSTRNPARVLKLERKGELSVGKDADVLVLEQRSLDIREVVARGRRMVVNGEPTVKPDFIEESSRKWLLVGAKHPEGV
jgi:beta-aspartyl-dipeptidase (metallo-type)